jgi:tetratricopeptide (TPR) repeat protein
VPPLAAAQPIVNQIVQLATHGIGDLVVSNYARENPPALPLTAAETDYLRTNGVSQGIIDLLRPNKPAPVILTNQPSVTVALQEAELLNLLKKLNEYYKAHQYVEALDYCKQALKLDPKNADAWCIKAGSEDALHNTAAAITAYATFLKLPEAQTARYAEWHSHATVRLRTLRGW